MALIRLQLRLFIAQSWRSKRVARKARNSNTTNVTAISQSMFVFIHYRRSRTLPVPAASTSRRLQESASPALAHPAQTNRARAFPGQEAGEAPQMGMSRRASHPSTRHRPLDGRSRPRQTDAQSAQTPADAIFSASSPTQPLTAWIDARN